MLDTAFVLFAVALLLLVVDGIRRSLLA